MFDVIAENAGRLCEATDVHIWRRDGDRLRVVASHGGMPLTRRELTIGRHSVVGRAAHDRRMVHIEDLAGVLTSEFPDSTGMNELGFRTILAVPLLRENQAIGVIMMRRRNVRRFSTRQLALVRTFADQAVIAIENARLFQELERKNRDLTETLEQQTATGEILRVISSSPQDVQPVFDTIAYSARRLCEAEFAYVFRYDGALVHLVAQHGLSSESLKALRNAWPAPLDGTTAAGRAIGDRMVAHIPDIWEDPTYGHNQIAAIANFRSVVAIPMLRDGEPIGAITVNRPHPGAFPSRLIELLKTFADQAVIAVENVRLFTELDARNRDLTETLDQQTATGEILRAISGSPTDVQPVFDAIARNARRLCGGEFCQVFRVEDGQLHNVANDGQNSEGLAAIRAAFPRPVDQGTSAGRAVLTAAVSQISDVTTEPTYGTAGVAQMVGFRSIASVPILHDGAPIGAIAVGRGEVGRFPEGQIELLKTFAEQAVIAIENVRLFKELEVRNRDLTETLEQQTATGEILRVISSSPTDAQPVFDTIASSGGRLCDARCFVFRFDGDQLHFVAQHGLSGDGVEAMRRAWPRTPTRGTAAGRAVLGRAAVHIADINRDPDYELGTVAQAGAWRATAAVPIMRDGAPIGVISLLRSEPGLFSNRQIELLRTFADQAVIAIENVRLFKELEDRNSALTEAHEQVTAALEQQTATADILRVISSSPTDIQPVFDTIARSAARLCEAIDVAVFRVDEDMLRLVAHHGTNPVGDVPIQRGTIGGRTVLDRRMIHLEDAQAAGDEFPEGSAFARERGFRTDLSVPLLREGAAIGNIQALRNEIRPYSEQQIRLLQTFADQAVIAIENVRLFKELEVRNRDLTQTLEQQTATSEILRVISGSPTDVQPVFDTIVERAHHLCDSDSASLFTYDGSLVHLAALDQTSSEQAQALRSAYPRPAEQGHATGRAIVTGRPVHIPDIRQDPAYTLETLRGSVALRTLLAVPMIRDGTPIGTITVQ
ncbi:MAG TPA: GAF domain-containing protein, partial [Methylomirabilota bacterium]